MSTHNRSASAPLGRAPSGRIGVAAALLIGITAHVPAAFAQQGPGLGRPISPADLAPWNIDVGTDGKELPAGSGKAKAGAAIYAAKCQTCHGADGKGQPADQLVGGQGTIDKFDQVRTVGSYWPYATTIFDYVRRAMPFNTPETLTNDEAYALTAYLLYKNGIIKENDEMSARTLARVRMPNVNGFIYEYPPKPVKYLRASSSASDRVADVGTRARDARGRCCASSQRAPLSRVGVLLEAHDLAVVKLPNVRELRVERFPRLPHLALVTSLDDHGVAAVDHVHRHDRETVDRLCDAAEQLADGVRADVRVAARERRAFRLAPLELRRQRVEQHVHLAARGGFVEALHFRAILHGRLLANKGLHA